ncbi:hypothetical protein J2S17_000652 [Cytobacillus purgationiresistens]|uniref:Uncharacterized protein n=1 Tax=Cytobacillus purgationiresistens TaxID=863449 RepID=A0ABU0AC00_9BACI|nr:hypothetical protein [Cytobacillus purgationiresistens]
MDNANNTAKFKRTIMIDTTAPDVEVSGLPASKYVEHNQDNPIVDVKVADNFDEIRLYLDGDEIYYQEFEEPFEMRGFEQVIEDIELELKDGPNQFVFEAVDLAGNKTAKTIELHKLKEGETAPDKKDAPDKGKPVPDKPSQIVKPENPGKGKVEVPTPSPTNPAIPGKPVIGGKLTF